MVVSCCAFNCQNRFVKDQLPFFHNFPKCEELRKKWIIATKRVNFTPTIHTKICSDHFLPDDYVIPGSRYLRKNSVPSQFDIPEHLQNVKKERNPPKRRLIDNPPAGPSKMVHANKKHKSSPTKAELKEQLMEKNKKIKTLNQAIRRKQKKLSDLKSVIETLKKKK